MICRPWVRTDHYWDVYWDLMKVVKQRFDAEGISIPFPQRDVHFYAEDPELIENVRESAAAKQTNNEGDTPAG